MSRRAVAPVIAACLVLRTLDARADPAAAEALFQEGRALLAQGEVGQACAKFEASQASEPSSGTLLNLATCRLEEGKTATAWAHFVAAERLAERQGRPEHQSEARARALELAPKLAYLTLRVTAPPPGLEVQRDGEPVKP